MAVLNVLKFFSWSKNHNLTPGQSGTGLLFSENTFVHCHDVGKYQGDAALCLCNLTKTFRTHKKQFTALKNINLRVRQGEFLCILGPSGCGKSTLLSLIAGLDHPDQGEIYSHCQRQDSPQALIIFQENALFPWLNVQDNVEFGLRMKGIAKTERREIAEKYLRLVHLDNFSQCYIHQLSGGMKQRVALARALAMEPDLLLMDEPFASLDIQTRRKLALDVQEMWQKTGKTIIFVTHHLEEAITLGDRVILFSSNPGQIKQEFTIGLPYPRQFDHPYLQEISRKIAGEFLSYQAAGRVGVV